MHPLVTFAGRSQFMVVANVATGEFSDADLNLAEVTGWQPEALIGRTARQWIHPDDRGLARAGAERLVEFGKSLIECRILHADGDYTTYQVASTLGSDGSTAYHWFRGAAQLVADHADLELYRTLVEVSADVFVVTDEFGVVEAINPAGARIHGMAQEEIVGQNLLDFMPPEGAVELERIAQRTLAGEQVVDFRVPAFDADGQIIYMEGQTSFDRDTRRYYTVERNVTDRIKRERELAIGHRFFELAGSQLALLDSENRILRANPAFLDCVEASHDDVTGEYLCFVVGVEDNDLLVEMIDRARRAGHTTSISIKAVTPKGPRMLQCSLDPADDAGSVYYSARDVTDEEQMAEELRDRAARDQLTRLATREVFHEALEAALAEGETAAVAMADLDEFKRVNDGLGHEAGDELLRQVGRRVPGAVRTDDLVARFGGDEFIVLLRNIGSDSDAMLAAEKIRAAVAHPYDIDGREIHTGISVGVTIGDGGSHDTSRFVREADAAAYEAQRSGRNTVRPFNSGLEAAIEREQIVEQELRAALRAGRIDVDVQGVFTTRGRLDGVEVLARMVMPNGERRAPGYFLDVAQRLGLLRELGEAVVERSCSKLSGWLRANPDLNLSINADPAELASPGWVEMIESALARHCIAPGQLVIEATERGMIDPHGPTGQALDQLRSHGVRIAIDDFGTGSSSLGYIRDGAVHAVKIDRSFTQQLTTNPVARSITVAVLSIANDLGIPVVAEGVEELHLLAVLDEIGCGLVQGFGLHRPQPIDEFLLDPTMVVDVVEPAPVAVRATT